MLKLDNFSVINGNTNDVQIFNHFLALEFFYLH